MLVFGQIFPTPCDCTATASSGNVNFSSLSWTGTGCPTAGSAFYSGRLCLTLVNGTNLIMDKDFTVNGYFKVSNSGNSTFTIPSTRTLSVTGNMGDDNNNNASFVVNGTLNIGGTLYGKNKNVFSGSGTVTAGGLDFSSGGNGANLPDCPNPCNINWNVTTCKPVGSSFCTTVLPVTLLFFEAKTLPDYVQLKWATASELNFDRFVIEKTRDGNVYEEIGERQGAGISNTRIDYSFKDEQVMLGRTYYRLKAIDFDGYTEYFGLVSAFYEGAQDVSIFPNPAAIGNVNIYFNYFSEEPVFCKVMDVSGSEVYTGTIQRTGFDSNYKIENTFASGMYFLEVRTGLSKKVIRFVVN